MTRDEAIAIRSRQLSGGAVSQNDAREAEEILKQTPKPVVLRKSKEVLTRLAQHGPMERDKFYAGVKALYSGPSAFMAITRMQERGLICCEVRLTEKGVRALKKG